MSSPDPSKPALYRRPAVVVGANLALLAILALLVIAGNPADASGADSANAPRARGEYTMLAGKGGSGSASTVYIIDGANAEMVSLRYDPRNHFAVSGYRSLEADAKATPQR